MFEELEKAIKTNAACHEETANDLAYLRVQLDRAESATSDIKSWLIALTIGMVLAMLLFFITITYVMESNSEIRKNNIHIEHLDKRLQEKR